MVLCANFTYLDKVTFWKLLFLHDLFFRQEKMIRNRFNSRMPENWFAELTSKFSDFLKDLYGSTMIKWKVNLGINLKITHNFNLLRCSLAVIKLTYRLKISPFLISPAYNSNLNYAKSSV